MRGAVRCEPLRVVRAPPATNRVRPRRAFGRLRNDSDACLLPWHVRVARGRMLCVSPAFRHVTCVAHAVVSCHAPRAQCVSCAHMSCLGPVGVVRRVAERTLGVVGWCGPGGARTWRVPAPSRRVSRVRGMCAARLVGGFVARVRFCWSARFRGGVLWNAITAQWCASVAARMMQSCTGGCV